MRALFAAVVALCLLAAPAQAAQRWLVVSDIHLNPYDRSAQPVPYGKDTNWALLRTMLARMRRVEPSPPVIVLAGDFLAHDFPALAHHAVPRQTAAAQALATIASIARAFRAIYPHARYVIALGNNDAPCGDYKIAPATAYLAALTRLWRLPREFAQGGYDVQAVSGVPLRIVTLDSVFWSFRYRDACGRNADDPGRAELAWFTRVLAATPRRAHDLVVMHIPPGIDPESTHLVRDFAVVPFLNAGDSAAFSRAVERAPVEAIVASHMHRASFGVNGGIPLLIVSSVSPVYDNNPSFTLLEVDAGGIADEQIDAYSLPDGTWEPPFDFDTAYGVSRIDAGSALRAHAAIARDPNVRRAWGRAFVGDADKRDITASDWRTFWCAQTETSSAPYEACAGNGVRVLVVPLALAGIGVLLVALATWLAIRLARQRRAP